MLGKLRVLSYDRQQKYAQGNRQSKVVDARHGRGNKLLNARS